LHRSNRKVNALYTRVAPWKPVIVALTGLVSAMASHAQAPSGAALVGALRQGGYVLVMRHSSSPAKAPDKATADPENSALERQLDETGRQTAHAMGEAIKRLHIPLGNVMSSPAYRVLQTVRLASLGTPKTFAELNVGGQNMMQAGTDSTRSAWLHQQVAVSPPPGTNTIIVTHAPNIIGAFGDSASDLSDGETLIFRPDGKGGAALIARVRIEEWPRLEGQK
jgi:phosphohistidine phosphatase SixA